MENILHSEWDKHGKTFGCEGTEGVNLSYSKWHCGIQPIHLLEFQHTKLAKVFSRRGKQRFRVVIKLLFGICRMHKGNHSEHHSLISCC